MLALEDLNGAVAVAALKKAEDSDELVLRLQERRAQHGQLLGELLSGDLAPQLRGFKHFAFSLCAPGP